MPTYSLINDGDSGLVVRTTLNDLLNDANNGVFVGPTGPTGPDGAVGATGATGSSAPAGLVNGTGTNSLKQDDALTTNPATASAADTIALGNGARSVNSNSVSIGKNTNSLGSDSVSIGNGASTLQDDFFGTSKSISIGLNAKSSWSSIAIGPSSISDREGSVAIGINSETDSNAARGIAIGNGAKSRSGNAVAIGWDSVSSGDLSVAIGPRTDATKQGSVAVGDLSQATAVNGIAIGRTSVASATGSVAIGATVSATLVDTVCMRALELQTLSSTQSGGILMYDTNGTSYRMNVSTSGELRLNNSTILGPTGATGAVGPTGATGPSITPFQTLTDAGTVSWNIANGYNAQLTLTGQNRVLEITGATNGDYGTLIINQDGVTASYLTITGKFQGGTYSFSGTASTDVYTFVYNGTDFFWNFGKNFS